MIRFLKGFVADIVPGEVVLEVNGVGYLVFVSASTLQRMPGIGQEAFLYTWMAVKEDGISLYGFLLKDELALFRLLIGVNGVGPKGALGILSGLSADALRFAILSGDAKSIQKAPGVGAKTAQRIILDLKDKLSPEDVFAGEDTQNSAAPGNPAFEAREEAAAALMALGYPAQDALKAVKRVADPEGMDAGRILKEALKKING